MEINEKERLLKMEIMPYSLHYINKREEMGAYKWGKFASKIKEAGNWHCSICGRDMSKTHRRLHLHEKWLLDEESLVAEIGGFIPLCIFCHAWKHIGFLEIQIANGWIDREEVENHYMKVNQITREEMEKDKVEIQVWFAREGKKVYIFKEG